MLKDGLLISVTSRFGEGVAWIIREAAWKVAAVVGITATGHRDFVAVVNQRRAARRDQKRVGELQPVARGAGFTHESIHVVQAKERHQRVWVRIQVIV